MLVTYKASEGVEMTCENGNHRYEYQGMHFSVCVDCNAPWTEGKPYPGPVIVVGSINAKNVTVAHTITGGLTQ
jgi:hypothetical protein